MPSRLADDWGSGWLLLWGFCDARRYLNSAHVGERDFVQIRGSIRRPACPGAIRTVRTWRAEGAHAAEVGQGIGGIGFKVKSWRPWRSSDRLGTLARFDDARGGASLCDPPCVLVARALAPSIVPGRLRNVPGWPFREERRGVPHSRTDPPAWRRGRSPVHADLPSHGHSEAPTCVSLSV